MSDPRDTSGPIASPTLEYGPQPAVSGLVVSRHGETVVAETVFTRRRALRAASGPIVWGFALTALMLGILWFMQLFLRRNPFGIEWTLALLPAPIGVMAAIAAVMRTLRPIRFEASPEALTCRVRRALEVVQDRWPRTEIADLRVGWMRVEDQQTWPRLSLVMRRQDGLDVALAQGTRMELQAICDVLRTGLRLSEDPLGARYYPAPPRGYRKCRRLLAGGIVLTFAPRYGLYLAAIVGIAFGVATFFIAPKLGQSFGVKGGLRMLQALGVATIGATVAYWLVGTLGRTTTILARNGYLLLTESGLPRPCHLEWSPEQVREIRLTSAGNDSTTQRSALEIVPHHGLAVTTLDGKPRHVLEWTLESLRVALMPVAAVSEAPTASRQGGGEGGE